jgi:hypothetical protein
LIDTNQPTLGDPEADRPEPDLPRFDFGHQYEVTGRSLLLFELIKAREVPDLKAPAVALPAEPEPVAPIRRAAPPDQA